MTKDEALRLALEALKETWYHVGTFSPTDEAIELYDKAIRAIKEALKIKDEPVAWEQFYLDIGKPQIAFNAEVVVYVAPQNTWVGLTDEEKAQFVVAYYPSNWDRKTAVSLMNDYEKYLKEKNNV